MRCTLVTDGSSDRVLIPILRWLLRSARVQADIEWAAGLKGKDTAGRIREAVELYPCDLLFVHRDAEKQSREHRRREIEEAASLIGSATPHVCVIPVRMTEAWLLFDEGAIREAANNRAGRARLNLPHVTRLETIPDPKKVLHKALRVASELSGRRRSGFDVHQRAHRVAESIDDFSALRQLPAFRALEADLKKVLQR